MIKLANPNVTEKQINYMVDVLKSGNLVQGRYVSLLENCLSEYFEGAYCVVVSSGTAALHLCIKLLNLDSESEVIVPAFTFPATMNVVELEKSKVKLVDIKTTDYCIDVDKIEEAITQNTKAIVVVHEFGVSADILAIKALAERYGLILIEDAACALGATFDSKKVGTFGELACFSLHPRKSITAGEGGFIITDNKEYYEKLLSLRNHGIEFDGEKIDFKNVGFNYRMTDFQAALAFGQFEELEDIIEKKEAISRFYINELKSYDDEFIALPKIYDNRKHTWQTFHILVKHNLRDELKIFLKSNNIESNYGAYAIHELTYYKEKYNLKDEDFYHSSKSFHDGLVLPNHSALSSEELQYIVDKIKLFFDQKLEERTYD